MPIDPVTVSGGAAMGAGPVRGGAGPATDAASFSSALDRSSAAGGVEAARAGGQPGTNPVNDARPPAREVERSALPAGSRDRLGHKVLDHIEGVQRGDARVRAEGTARGPVRPAVASVLPPGPAAQPLTAKAGPAQGQDGFQVQLNSLKEMYDQAVQVSLMTKSTGALNGTVNKLTSAQ
jgi:hypothetical protein